MIAVAVLAALLLSAALLGGARHGSPRTEDELHFERFRAALLDTFDLLLGKPQITAEQASLLRQSREAVRTMRMPVLLPPVSAPPPPPMGPPDPDPQINALAGRLLPELAYLVPRTDLAGLDQMAASGVTGPWAAWIAEVRARRAATINVSGDPRVVISNATLGTLMGRAIRATRMG